MTIDSLNFMLVEIVACLAIAALLGLFVGWMIRRALAKRHAAKAALQANEKYKELEKTSLQDSKNLEDQIQTLGDELKSVKNNNQSLNTSLKDTESSIHQARSESIELNQAQLETNERLQAIIRSKDKEISQLMKSGSSDSSNLAAAAAGVGASAALVSRVAKPSDDITDTNETLDATTVLKGGPLHQSNKEPDGENANDTMAALDAGTNQLRNERQALLDAITDGEETVAINHRDLPVELQNAVTASDSDQTVAMSDFDKTVSLDSDDDTEMSDTLETP